MIKEFFKNSDYLDHMSLRHLAHIRPHWELTWDYDNDKYFEEEGSFAKELNELIEEISNLKPPAKYHDNEDVLAEYVIKKLNWNIIKKGNLWTVKDYPSLLEQGGHGDPYEKNLVLAATGRIHAALKFKQFEFDKMEEGHQKILGYVIAIILFHRHFQK